MASVADAGDAIMSLSSAPRSIIGRRIRVHWPDDDEWWFGVVENYTSRRGWKVSYEKVDGEDDLIEWHDLDAVQHEIMPDAKHEALLVPTAQRVGTPPADPARQTHAMRYAGLARSSPEVKRGGRWSGGGAYSICCCC